jgi:predicted SAM-dependent methyltransferase
MPGWINMDTGNKRRSKYRNKSELDLCHNLARGIPFPSETVDYIYHQHLIEHLHRKDGLKLTRDCFRVLKPGGVLRIAFPALEDLIASYQAGFPDHEWYYKVYPKRRGLSPAELFNLDFRENGEHRHIYDEQDIRKLIVQGGFDENRITFHPISESSHEALQNLETRTFNKCVEVVKMSE